MFAPIGIYIGDYVTLAVAVKAKDKEVIGMRTALNDMYQIYQKPLFIVENGIGVAEVLDQNHCVEDNYRIEYHRAHIKAMLDAIEDVVDVMGYLVWSPMDIIKKEGYETSTMLVILSEDIILEKINLNACVREYADVICCEIGK